MRKRKYCNISAQQTLLQTAMDNLNSNSDLLQYQSMSEEQCLQMLLNRLDKKNVCQKFRSEDINVPTSHNMVSTIHLKTNTERIDLDMISGSIPNR
jgi:hypothetical protein